MKQNIGLGDTPKPFNQIVEVRAAKEMIAQKNFNQLEYENI